MDVAVESQPRPMPPEVLRAYRDPMPLRELLASSVYSAADRAKVRDALLEALLEQYGNVEVFVRGEEQLVSTRAKSMRKVVDAIEFLLEVPDYGGRYATLPVLARVMQPRWGAWWGAFEWSDYRSIRAWRDVAVLVLGDQQFRWLAAQYARTAFDGVFATDRRVVLDAIEAAEAYAVEPTQQRLAAMLRARSAVSAAAVSATSYAAATYATFYAADAFYAAAAIDAADADASYAAAAAADAYASYAAAAADAAYAAAYTTYQRLADLTRRLISPQLIASESSGVRASLR